MGEIIKPSFRETKTHRDGKAYMSQYGNPTKYFVVRSVSTLTAGTPETDTDEEFQARLKRAVVKVFAERCDELYEYQSNKKYRVDSEWYNDNAMCSEATGCTVHGEEKKEDDAVL